MLIVKVWQSSSRLLATSTLLLQILSVAFDYLAVLGISLVARQSILACRQHSGRHLFDGACTPSDVCSNQKRQCTHEKGERHCSVRHKKPNEGKD